METETPTFPHDLLLPPRIRRDLIKMRAERLRVEASQTTTAQDKGEEMADKETTDELTILPRAVNDAPKPIEAEAAEPVTLETLRFALNNALAELSALESKQAELAAELRQASENPNSFNPDRILSLRRQQEENTISLALAKMTERQAQLDYYAGLVQSALWRQETEIAERERLAAELADVTARFEAAQGRTAATSQSLHDLRQLSYRVLAELDSLRVAFVLSQTTQAARAPLPPRQDLNESVRLELASIGYMKGQNQ